MQFWLQMKVFVNSLVVQSWSTGLWYCNQKINYKYHKCFVYVSFLCKIVLKLLTQPCQRKRNWIEPLNKPIN